MPFNMLNAVEPCLTTSVNLFKMLKQQMLNDVNERVSFALLSRFNI